MYDNEINRKQFELLLINLIANFEETLSVISYHWQRDAFYELENNEIIRILDYYNRL